MPARKSRDKRDDAERQIDVGAPAGSADTTIPRERDAIVTGTRLDMAPILASVSAGSEQAGAEDNIRAGDAFAAAGQIPEAVAAYSAAHAVDKLVELEALVRQRISEGDALVEQKKIKDAIGAYKAAGAAEKLVALGHQSLEEGYLQEGQSAYAAAGRDVPRQMLIACGDSALDGGYTGTAVKAYAAANALTKLKSLGYTCVAAKRWDNALDAFIALGDVEELNQFAERCMSAHKVTYAVRAFVAAGETPEYLEAIGDRWLEGVRAAYEAAGTAEKLAALPQEEG